MSDPVAVLDFWLDEIGPEGWYAGTQEVDDACAAGFADLVTAAREGNLEHWIDGPAGTLDGSETDISVHVFTSEDAPIVCRQIASKVRDVLQDSTPTMTGTAWCCRNTCRLNWRAPPITNRPTAAMKRSSGIDSTNGKQYSNNERTRHEQNQQTITSASFAGYSSDSGGTLFLSPRGRGRRAAILLRQ